MLAREGEFHLLLSCKCSRYRESLHSRPLLLRATSTKLAKAFSHAKHPHGNAISADAFARGVVKSGTDYTVYTIARMQGLDFTFYRQRNKYHTKDDSVPSLGGKAALWDMLEGTLMTGLALANDGSSDDDTSMPVYFDGGSYLSASSLSCSHLPNSVWCGYGRRE